MFWVRFIWTACPLDIGRSYSTFFLWPVKSRVLPQKELIKTCNIEYQWEACSFTGLDLWTIGSNVNIRNRPVFRTENIKHFGFKCRPIFIMHVFIGFFILIILKSKVCCWQFTAVWLLGVVKSAGEKTCVSIFLTKCKCIAVYLITFPLLLLICN